MLSITRRGFVLLAGAAGLAACSPYYVPTATTGPDQLTEAAILRAVNEVRAQNNIPPLSYNSRLESAAREQARAMAAADSLSHSLGTTLRERTNRAGYQGAVGENLAGGPRTLEAAIAGWLASPGHRSTLLSIKFTEFGLAAARVSSGRDSLYEVYWAFVAGGDAANFLMR